MHFQDYIKQIIELRRRALKDKELKKKDALYLKGKVWKLKKDSNQKP